MIDLHSHIIYGVDDGPSSIEQSVKMVQEAEKLGIRVIIATPHYHEAIFEVEKAEDNYQELLYKAQQYEVSIKMGYEVFINPENPSFKRNRKKSTLNRTGKMLIEFPFNARPDQCIEAVKKLILDGVTPVIAHPERNRNFLNSYGQLTTLIKSGCLLQVDAASIAGVYGGKIKEFAKRLIQLNYADMVASNAHCSNDYANWYMEAYNNVIQWAGQENASKLFYQNAKGIVDNAEDNMLKNVVGLRGELL